MMTLFSAKLIWFLGFVIGYLIRLPHERRSWRTRTAHRFDRVRDYGPVAVCLLGQGIVPGVYAVTDQPAFATYTFQPLLAWLGAAVFAFALWLFHRAHRDLGRNWSVSLKLRDQHALVTTGVYQKLRHPMYAAFLLSAAAQALLLPNWFTGLAGLVGFATMFLARVWREEQMMVDAFGDDYRLYMARTNRLIPGIF
jgi:protein-S-isoprenylcysteine O-methyltransferase Ste14